LYAQHPLYLKVWIFACRYYVELQGINLPAHLVVIKSTAQYIAGKGTEEISEMNLLQMIGRAGRPQFDKSGIAVIMTRRDQVKKYENIAQCQQYIESNLVHST